MTFYALASEGAKFGLIEPGWTMAFQLVNTFILFMFLRKFLFKPVTSFMEKRESEIKSTFDLAEKKNLEAEQIMADYKDKIKNAEQEGKEIVRNATMKAENRSTEIVKSAEEHAQELKDKAQKEIEREKAKAIHLIKDEIASMAILAAGKVVEADMSVEKHQSMVEKFIDEVGDTRWQN